MGLTIQECKTCLDRAPNKLFAREELFPGPQRLARGKFSRGAHETWKWKTFCARVTALFGDSSMPSPVAYSWWLEPIDMTL